MPYFKFGAVMARGDDLIRAINYSTLRDPNRRDRSGPLQLAVYICAAFSGAGRTTGPKKGDVKLKAASTVTAVLLWRNFKSGREVVD